MTRQINKEAITISFSVSLSQIFKGIKDGFLRNRGSFSAKHGVFAEILDSSGASKSRRLWFRSATLAHMTYRLQVGITLLLGALSSGLMAEEPANDALASLNVFVGHWSERGEMASHSRHQNARTFTSSDTTEWILGGHFLRTIARYEMEGGGFGETVSLQTVAAEKDRLISVSFGVHGVARGNTQSTYFRVSRSRFMTPTQLVFERRGRAAQEAERLEAVGHVEFQDADHYTAQVTLVSRGRVYTEQSFKGTREDQSGVIRLPAKERVSDDLEPLEKLVGTWSGIMATSSGDQTTPTQAFTTRWTSGGYALLSEGTYEYDGKKVAFKSWIQAESRRSDIMKLDCDAQGNWTVWKGTFDEEDVLTLKGVEGNRLIGTSQTFQLGKDPVTYHLDTFTPGLMRGTSHRTTLTRAIPKVVDDP